MGATGAVGRVLLELIVERRFPANEVVAIASARSAGRSLSFGKASLQVHELTRAALDGLDMVLLDVPDDVARHWAPIAVEAGAVVVDNSAAWRMEPDVPLVVPEINPTDVAHHKGIIASPNCTTIGVVVPLYYLHRRFGLQRVVVSSYQAVSGIGRAGVDELKQQSEKLVNEIEELGRFGAASLAPVTDIFIKPIAFNVVPLIGSEGELGYTGEEWKLLYEARKILGLPELEVTATCVRVPTVVGHGASVLATFEKEVSVAGAIEVLDGASGVELDDLPTPLDVAGTDPVRVGRIRPHTFDARSLWFFSVSDNLRKGAALNTLQIAELLQRGQE